jgi:hypothetical protein
MNLNTLLSLCRRFSDLGGAVQDQLSDAVENDTVEDQNPAALKMADDNFLRYLEKALPSGALLVEVKHLRAEIREGLAEIEKIRKGSR